MELFRTFDDQIKREFLFAPLKHPNINYKWIEKNIIINGENSSIICIGSIIDDGEVDIITNKDFQIGFWDKNSNFVTPILFHPINLKNKGYKILYKTIEDELKQLSNNKPDSLSKKINKIIDLLDDDVPFYMDVLKYIRSGKFDLSENNITKEDIDELIEFVKAHGAEIIIKYPHLKLMISILENKAI